MTTGLNNEENTDLLTIRFQEVVNSLASTLQAKSALITKLSNDALVVSAASKNADNPFKAGDSFALNSNVFCLKVTKSKSPLLIYNDTNGIETANQDPRKLDYYGFPLFSPSGSIYGTLCIMEANPHQNIDSIRTMIESFRTLIENDFHYFSIGADAS